MSDYQITLTTRDGREVSFSCPTGSDVISAGAGVKTTDDKYDLVVWAKNLGNVRAITTQSLSTNVTLGGVSFVDPFTIGATLRTRF